MKHLRTFAALIAAVSVIASAVFVMPTVIAQAANLTEGCEVKATAQLSNYDIARVIDGNTAFNAQAGKTAITGFDVNGYGFYEISFSHPVTVDLVKLYFNQVEANQRPRDIAIDVRQENGVYVRMAEMHGIDYNIQGNGYGAANELYFAFSPAECAAVRVTGNRQRTRDINNEPTANYNFRLMEIEVYNESGIAPENYTGVYPDENVAYNIPVPDPVLSNLVENCAVESAQQLGDYDISRLTNGFKKLTSDCAITSFNTANLSSYEIIPGEETELNQVRLYFSTYEVKQRPKDIAVDIRLSNGVYVRVAELHDIDYEILGANSAQINTLDFKFENKKAVAIRIIGNRQRTRDANNEPTANYNFRLVEAEAYLNAALKEEDYTGVLPDENAAYNIPVTDPLLTNLAAGKTVTASDELTAGGVAYSASHLTDGNVKYTAGTETNAITKWNSVTKTAYFEIDLEQAVTVNRTSVFLTQWQKEYLPLDVAVDVRQPNGVYKRVAEMHNIDYTGKEKLTFAFEEVDAVAVRFTGNCARNAKSENFRLMEIEVSYYPGIPEELLTGTAKDDNELYNIPVPEPVLPNLAAGKKVTANEIITAGEVTYKAEHLTDGNTGYTAGTETNAITKWNNTTKQGYFEIEFDECQLINRTTVFLTQWQKESLPKEIAVDVRQKDGVYKRAAEMHDIDYSGKKSLIFSFEDIEAVAVRITGNCARNEKSENFRLMEIEVCYYPGMPEELLTGTENDENDAYNIPVPDPVLDNLAAGKKVTANETLAVKDVVYDANLLTDGNRNYYTGTSKTAITRLDSPTKSGWFEVDFGQETKINRVAIFLSQWEKNILPKDLAVDVRISNGVYKRVAEMHDINYTDVKQLTASFDEISAVAFRVTGKFTRNKDYNNFRLVELEAYFYPGMPKVEITGVTPDPDEKYNIPVPDPLMKNLALGMKAIANEELVANGVTYSASRLTDGYVKYNCSSATAYTAITRWISKKKLGWYEVLFNEPTKFNRVTVCLSQWEKKFLPLDMAVEVKMATGEYVRVAEMHNIDYAGKQKLIFDFPEQVGVSFRVIGNANRNQVSNNFRIIELQAYYWPGMPAKNFTGIEKDPNSLYNINDADLIAAPKTKKNKDKNKGKKPNSNKISGYTLPVNMATSTPAASSERSDNINVNQWTILFVVAAAFLAFTFAGETVFLLILANKRFKKRKLTAHAM